MNAMSRLVLFIAALILIGCSSCVKKGPTKACFTFSKSVANVNDTIYILNCSENYTKFAWINPNGFYPGGATLDTVHRHQKVVVTASGQYNVTLRVGPETYYSTSTDGYYEVTKAITVN